MKQQTGKTKYALISAIVMLAVALIASVSALFAWFAQAGGVRMNGAQLSVVGENMRLGAIELTRIYDFGDNGTYSEESVYMREENGDTYYLYNNTTGYAEPKIPLALDGLTNKEKITLVIKFYADKSYDTYSVSFKNVTGEAAVLGCISYGEGKFLTEGTVKLIENAEIERTDNGGAAGSKEEFCVATINLTVDFKSNEAYESLKGKVFSVGGIVLEVGRKSA